MRLLLLQVPFWVLSVTTIVTNTVSAQFYPMEAQSPGKPEVLKEHHEDVNKKILVAIIVASTALGALILFLSCFWVYRRRKFRNSDAKSGKKMEEAAKKGISSEVVLKFGSARMGSRKISVAIFDYQLLEDATENFSRSNVFIESVYRARFDEKLLAVVRKLEEASGSDAERRFDNEVNWLSQIRHQNIIKLLGYCVNGKSRFLVYEMMQNGSLETQLHGPTEGLALTWHMRLKIAVDIARGLEYLHENCNPPLVHRDIQLRNILLDSNFNAKLFNFGLAVPSGMENKDNVVLSGTSAYVAPEYMLDGKLTDKSDVYAFGVVLLELLMGRKVLDSKASAENHSLVKLAMPQLSDRTKLPNAVDPAIRNTMDLKHLYQVAAVAVLCVQPEPSYRPLITDVLHSLIPLVPLELGGSLRLTEPQLASLSLENNCDL